MFERRAVTEVDGTTPEETMLLVQMHYINAVRDLYIGGEEEEGQGLVEYALILAFVAVLIIVALIFLKDQILGGYSRIGNSIPTQ